MTTSLASRILTSLLFYVLLSPQSFFKTIAREIFPKSKSDHVTSQFKLYWLPIATEIKIRLFPGAHEGLCVRAPAHLTSAIFTAFEPLWPVFTSPTPHPMALARALSTAWNALLPTFSQLVSSHHLGLSLSITSSVRSLLPQSLLYGRISVTRFIPSCFPLVAHATVCNYVYICHWICIITVCVTRPVTLGTGIVCVLFSPLFPELNAVPGTQWVLKSCKRIIYKHIKIDGLFKFLNL